MKKIIKIYFTKHLLVLKTLISLFLILLGTCMISLYIYIRFIRERLPQDIPITLTELRFYILIFVCLTYIYIIYKHFFPPKTVYIFVIKVIAIFQYLFIPLKTLDTKIKSNTYVHHYYNNLFDEYIPYIKKWAYKNPGSSYLKNFYIVCTIVPSLVLIFIFSLDVFVFNQIKYLYSFIFLGVLPLFHIYIKYSLYFIKETYIINLEKQYKEVFLRDSAWMEHAWDPDDQEYTPLWTPQTATIYHETTMSIRSYIAFQLELDIQNDVNNANIKYDITPHVKQEFYESYIKDNNMNKNSKLTKKDMDFFYKPFEEFMPKILELDEFLDFYSQITERKTIYKKIKICIITGYLVCWTYILIKSFHTVTAWPLTLKVLEILILYIPTIEPFSNTLL